MRRTILMCSATAVAAVMAACGPTGDFVPPVLAGAGGGWGGGGAGGDEPTPPARPCPSLDCLDIPRIEAPLQVACEVEPFIPLPPPAQLHCDVLGLPGTPDIRGSIAEGYIEHYECPLGWVLGGEFGGCVDPANPGQGAAMPKELERCEFNERGQLVFERDWYGDSISAAYDDEGRLVGYWGDMEVSFEHWVTYEAEVVYDANGRLIAGNGLSAAGLAFEYSGGQFCRVFNDAGQLVGSTRRHSAVDGDGVVTTLERCVAPGPSDACPGPELDCVEYTEAEVAACQL